MVIYDSRQQWPTRLRLTVTRSSELPARRGKANLAGDDDIIMIYNQVKGVDRAAG
jgi:hypothetical protein